MKFAYSTALLGLALASPAAAGDDVPKHPDTDMADKNSHYGKPTHTDNVYECAEWCKNRHPTTPPAPPQPPVYTNSHGSTGGSQGSTGGSQGSTGGSQDSTGGSQGSTGGEQDINSYNKPPVVIAAGDRVQPVLNLLALAVAAFL